VRNCASIDQHLRPAPRIWCARNRLVFHTVKINVVNIVKIRPIPGTKYCGLHEHKAFDLYFGLHILKSGKVVELGEINEIDVPCNSNQNQHLRWEGRNLCWHGKPAITRILTYCYAQCGAELVYVLRCRWFSCSEMKNYGPQLSLIWVSNDH